MNAGGEWKMTVHYNLTADEDAAHGYYLPLVEFMAGDVGILKQSLRL